MIFDIKSEVWEDHFHMLRLVPNSCSAPSVSESSSYSSSDSSESVNTGISEKSSSMAVSSRVSFVGSTV